MPIRFENVFYSYSVKTPFRNDALKGVSLSLDDHGVIAIIGKTGSGKSTLIQHINALLTPLEGKVVINDFVNASKKRERTKKIEPLREEVGMVFQFPEAQLFEDTVLKDVSFGPRNFGHSKEESERKAVKALRTVGLDESFDERSPFQLSGGEKRKVAIAGVLALNPKILILDEPTSGLDPLAAAETMDLFMKIWEQGVTVIMVTHDMDLAFRYATHVVLMESGAVKAYGPASKIMTEELEGMSFDLPRPLGFAKKLEERGFIVDGKAIRDIPSLAEAIKEGGKRHE